jgi:N-acyl-D-aspartate/D-glutamate deacylase
MRYLSFLLALFFLACTAHKKYDVIIRNGLLYDGGGNAPVQTDIAMSADSIAAIGDLSNSSAEIEIDARDMAVAPGFINMLSWATVSLIEDGRSQSDIQQGVTLEVFGEGWSNGPLTDAMKNEEKELQTDIKYDIKWTTLSEYLNYLVDRGVSCNIASFVGATTLRIHEIGYEDRPPTADELERMKALTRQAMEEGALGIGSSLIYAPAFYAKTAELIELCKVAASYGGMYISHMRNESDQLLVALDELLTIAREADIPAEIYHLKAAGQANWDKLDALIEKVDQANRQGQRISADMYTYTAGATGLDAAMPPWVQEGGLKEWVKRLKDPKIRKKVVQEMLTPTDKWENLMLQAGSPEKVLLVGFKTDSLKKYTGKTLAEMAQIRAKSPQDVAIDLVIEDNSRVETIYFLMSDENIKKKIALPWVSFGSDESSPSAEGVFLKSNPHPRAYGTFARLLGRYVREEGVISLQEAIRRLTSFPAANLGIKKRGWLKPGYFADVVIFDPATIRDHATYEKPHQYATGVRHVFVNGQQVISNGRHTSAKPGRVVYGPGWKGWQIRN